MSTETYVSEKLVLTDKRNNSVIFFEVLSNDEITVTNNDTEEFDATTFWFNITKEDWAELINFIDKQHSK